MDWSARRDGLRRRADRLGGAGVREANAHIQSGSYFGRINRPCATDRVLIHGVGSLSKQRSRRFLIAKNSEMAHQLWIVRWQSVAI